MLRKLLALSLTAGMLVFATGCPTKDKKTRTATGKVSGIVTFDKPSLELSPPADVKAS